MFNVLDVWCFVNVLAFKLEIDFLFFLVLLQTVNENGHNA